MTNPAARPVVVTDDTSTIGFAPRRLHPAWIILTAIQSLRGLVLPLAVLVISGGRQQDGAFLAIAGVLALGSIGLRAASWWMFRYEVSGGELRVRSGLIARRERSVPLERIQAVDTSESPLQRLFGVVRVKIETAAAGAAGSDVTLEALSHADASDLRHRLSAERFGPGSGSPIAGDAKPQEAAGELIRTMTPAELFVAGVTSGRIGPALALLFGAFQFADELLPDSIWEPLAMEARGFSLRGLLTLLVVVGLGAWLLALASTVLTFGGFELRREGDRLHIAYGLLDRRRSTIPLARIQAITMTEGLLRQPFGLATLRIESAAYGKATAESGVLFPLVRTREAVSLLQRACPAFAAASIDPGGSRLHPLPRRAMRRYVLSATGRVAALAAVVCAVAALVPEIPWWIGVPGLLLALPAALHGLLGYRDAGWAIDSEERIVVRERSIGRRTIVTARRRLQHRQVVRGPFQRRARLATLRAAVASSGGGGHLALVHLDEGDAFDLLSRLGRSSPVSSERTPVP
ncbi:MAG: PH domain-containing protein [Chloroflexota bacterium]|nr:PH domain-containing protein [Chloroflexota bacterium]